MSKEISTQKDEFNSLKTRINKLETRQDNLQLTLDKYDTRLQGIEDQLHNLNVNKEAEQREKEEHNALLNSILMQLKKIPSEVSNPEMHDSIFFGGPSNSRVQERDYQKIKKEFPKYDGKDHRGAIVWVNKMEGIFESNPPLGEREKIMTTSNSLEGEAYDWYLWWSGKCNVRSFQWNFFVAALLKRFYDEEDDLYNKFINLKQKGNVNDYTHNGKF